MTNVYNIYSNIYYNNNKERYENIVCINKFPEGELKNNIIKIKKEQLSEFHKQHDNYNSNCIYAIKSFDNCNELLNPNNIEELYSFLLSNSYEIDYEFTNLLNNNKNNYSKRTIMYIKLKN